MDAWAKIGLLCLGGSLGANARYWMGSAIQQAFGSRFPIGTFVVNVLGAFLAGLFAGVMAWVLPHPYWRVFALSGFLGGFTTFSALELESLDLARAPGWGWGGAAANLGGSIVAGFVAVLAGAWLAGVIVGPGTPGPKTTPPPVRVRPGAD